MTTGNYHLAQLNVARAKGEKGSAVMEEFFQAVDHINALAEQAPGFVWRLKDEDGDATGIRPFDDPRMLVNLTLWTDLDALREYAYKGDHLTYVRRRHEWFERPSGPVVALWWVPAGTVPTLEDARNRLERLATEGPSEAVFTFAKPFPPPGEQG